MAPRFADATFWIAAACCALAQAAIIRSAVVSPASAAGGAGPASRTRRVVEVCWAILPGLALIALFFLTWRAMHTPPAITLEPALVR